MRAAGALLALAPLLAASSALAQPSVWDVARDRNTARDYQTLLAVERMLSHQDGDLGDAALESRLLNAAIAILELAGGTETSDPRLLFVAGDLLSNASVARDAEARRLIDRALSLAPTSPLAGRGWFNVAIASARLKDPERERAAYTQALELVFERGFRANIYANRGESNMVLGKLDLALIDYRRAIEVADRPDLQALAYYGLGTALERNGDLPAALDAMRVARGIRIPFFGSALDMPSVFFVPEYDVYYYKALSQMAAARDAKKPESRARHLLAAVELWQKYLEPAAADGHRWVPNARRHHDGLMKQLKKLVPTLTPRAAKAPAVR